MSKPTPKEIVNELNRFIIGQDEAKKAVAIALRNKWRRMKVEKEMQQEITPKNILLIGLTGVGKTEIARRLAKITNAPFIKIEATKFTEVGYVGKDVDSIIRDLVDISIRMYNEQEKLKIAKKAKIITIEKILDILLPGYVKDKKKKKERPIREFFKKKLKNKELDNKEIEIELSSSRVNMEIIGMPGMEEMTNQLQNMLNSLGPNKKNKRKVTIKKAFDLLQEEETAKFINEEEIKKIAIQAVEQHGIVFIDEIDKICKNSDNKNNDISREGVQRDLLPLIEGATISTKYGMVKTDHILFIASGAFHISHPSDLIPELQGRLPIRVTLETLTVRDFTRILTEPDFSLIKQYVVLLKTENLFVDFTQNAIIKIAEIAHTINETIENIGARRLHTVFEKLLEDLSFKTNIKEKTKLKITTKYVDSKLHTLTHQKNINQYII